MRGQFVEFMEKIFNNGHAEVAPPLEENEEGWYLPTFGVYHPQKPGSIRMVFDSSAKYFGTSLNDVLLTGPDLNNSLIGVLIRFRNEQVAVIADIQQMFHCFLVRKDHRNYLRFLWYRDNDMSKDIVDYRVTVHIPRAYTATSLSNAEHTELCVFSDASTKAIGAVAYLRTIQAEGQDEDDSS